MSFRNNDTQQIWNALTQPTSSGNNFVNNDLFQIYTAITVSVIGSATTLNISGLTVSTLSATTLSAGTLYSGSTNLYNIFATATSSGNTVVSAGSNISVVGQPNNPFVSTVASPSFNNESGSGTSTWNALTATTISGGTLYSGSTNLYSIFGSTNYIPLIGTVAGSPVTGTIVMNGASANIKGTNGNTQFIFNNAGADGSIAIYTTSGGTPLNNTPFILMNSATTTLTIGAGLFQSYIELQNSTQPMLITANSGQFQFGNNTLSITERLDIIGQSYTVYFPNKNNTQVFAMLSDITGYTQNAVFKSLSAATVSANTYSANIQTLAYASTTGFTWDVSKGEIAQITLTAATTATIINPTAGSYYTLRAIQDAIGSRTLALPANSKVAYSGNGLVTLSTGATVSDILTALYDGSNYYWNYALNYN
jgi:hypothetical protein